MSIVCIWLIDPLQWWWMLHIFSTDLNRHHILVMVDAYRKNSA